MNSIRDLINVYFLKVDLALTSVAQLVGHCLAKLKVAGSIPRSGHIPRFMVGVRRRGI